MKTPNAIVLCFFIVFLFFAFLFVYTEHRKPVEISDNPNSSLELVASPGEKDGISSMPLMIWAEASGYKDGVLTVTVINESGYDMTYSENFLLEKKTNGKYYRLHSQTAAVPGEDDLPLADLEQAEVLCDLNSYGQLKAGYYRITLGDLTAEFRLR